MFERKLAQFINFLRVAYSNFKTIFNKFYFYIIIIACIILAILDYNNENLLLQNFRNLFLDTASPMMVSATKLINEPRNFKQFVSSLYLAHTENLNLKEVNHSLIEENESLKQLINENIELKKLLNYVNDSDFRYITARVIGNISGPYTRKAIILAGEKNGIKKGQIVINHTGVVGRIIEVGEKTSRILLITDFNSKIPIILSDSRQKAIAAGNNTSNLELLYLSKDNDVRIGEAVLTIGDNEFFPSNVIIGYVTTKQEDIVKVRPKVNLSELDFVSVIIN